MKLTPSQISKTVDLWVGKCNFKESEFINLKSSKSQWLKEINHKGDTLFNGFGVGGDVFKIEKHTFKLLNEIKIRYIQKFLKNGSDKAIHFLGGTKKGILETFVPINVRDGCAYFRSIDPHNFIQPMIELQVNGYIPNVLIRVTWLYLGGSNSSSSSRVREMKDKSSKQNMIVCSAGVGGLRVENQKGDMKIEIV